MMDDVPNNHGLNNGAGSIGMSIGGSKQHEEQPARAQYSMPGILHFLQTEWARFEMEKSQWEVERAELQARIAFLQGERKGQENLKQDLVRRIKMLEFALKQERAKFHKLKYGTELNQGEIRPPVFDKKDDEPVDGEALNTANSNVTWRQGRQLLRQYLQEIGYTDTIIDVRSSRVRQLLGLQSQNAEGEENRPMVNGDGGGGKRPSEGQGRRTPKKIPASMAERALMDSEASVIATFDFLATENVDDDEEENLSDGENEGVGLDEVEVRAKGKPVVVGNESMAGMEDEEEALAEFDFLMSESGSGEVGADKKDLSPSEEWGMDQQHLSKLKEDFKRDRKGKKGVQRIRKPGTSALQEMMNKFATDIDDISSVPIHANNSSPSRGNMPNSMEVDEEKGIMPGVDEPFEPALGLGELEGLTVNNEADPLSYDISATKEAFRKTWNAKYTLRSHFDGVRSLAFHPVEPVLITASEDHTLKLWNLQKTVPVKKSASLDVEPIYTFRGHVGPVLCLAVSPTGETCYSGGADAAIRCWNIPNSNIDPYDSFDPSVLADTLVAHTNAVWGLSIHSAKMQLLSCSADGTVRLWNPGTKTPLLNTYSLEHETGLPTSVDFVRCEPSQMVAAYSSANTYIYDLETGKEVIALESNQTSEPAELNNQVNCVISHPTLPVTITAHEDRHIRFFDNNSGKMVHSMVAHLDAVTSLAVDPNGLYLLSGSHDCSIRLWNLDSKTCVQEITSHRKKFDEAIHDVAFHPSKPFIASAGADALAKVFV